MPAPFWQQDPQDTPAPQQSFWTPTFTASPVIGGLSVPSDESGFAPGVDNPTAVPISGLTPGDDYLIAAHRQEYDFDPWMELYSGLHQELPGNGEDSFIDHADDTIPHPGPWSDPQIEFTAPESGEVTAFVTSSWSGDDDGGDGRFNFEIRLSRADDSGLFWQQNDDGGPGEPAAPFWGNDDANDDGIMIEALAPNGFAMPDLDDESPILFDAFDGDVSINDVTSIVQISGLDPEGQSLGGPEGEDTNAILFVLPRVDSQAELELLEQAPPEFLFFRRPEEGDDVVHPFETSILLFEGLLDADDFGPEGDLDEPFADNLDVDPFFGGFFGPSVFFEVPESGEVTALIMDGGLFDSGGGMDGTGDGLIDFSLGVIHEDTEEAGSDLYFELAPNVPNVFWGPQEDPIDFFPI